MACARCFHDTPRLYKHIAYGSAKCRQKYMSFFPDISQQDREASYVPPPPKAKKHLLPPPVPF